MAIFQTFIDREIQLHHAPPSMGVMNFVISTKVNQLLSKLQNNSFKTVIVSVTDDKQSSKTNRRSLGNCCWEDFQTMNILRP